MDITFQKMLAFMQEHYLKNRTMVSRDIKSILSAAAEYLEMQPIMHKFSSDEEYATWVIPQQWDVNRAYLKMEGGPIIASYEDHPLFIAPYSKAFFGIISYDELLLHISSNPLINDDGYYYEYRLTFDYQRRLKEWRMTLPKSIIAQLDPSKNYEVCIDVNIQPGEMLVAEFVLPGKRQESIALLADYCHPGQINDSFTGLVVQMEVFKWLAQQTELNYTYRLFLLPETLGSAALLANNPQYLKIIKGAFFTEMVGWGSEWKFKKTFKGQSYIDKIIELVAGIEKINVVNFNDSAGNDEIIFDWAGIPSVSLIRYPYDQYHSSEDNLERVEPESLHQAIHYLQKCIHIIETDKVWQCVHPVPFYMTRYNLYHDSIYQTEDFQKFRNFLFNLDGERSLVNIAHDLKIDYFKLLSFLEKTDYHKLTAEITLGMIVEAQKHVIRKTLGVDAMSSSELDNVVYDS